MACSGTKERAHMRERWCDNAGKPTGSKEVRAVVRSARAMQWWVGSGKEALAYCYRGSIVVGGTGGTNGSGHRQGTMVGSGGGTSLIRRRCMGTRRKRICETKMKVPTCYRGLSRLTPMH